MVTLDGGRDGYHWMVLEMVIIGWWERWPSLDDGRNPQSWKTF